MYLCRSTHLVVAVVLMFSACAYDNEEELFGSIPCNPIEATYSDVVMPILTNNCNIPSCHDGSNPAIPDWTIFENVQSSAQSIKQRTGNRTMPPSNSGLVLTSGQVADIACWVDNGAQNN